MAQSYGNLSISTILAATDEILGTDVVIQKYGTSMSAASAVTILAAATTLSIAINGAAPVVIAIPACINAEAIAAAIQTQVRLAGVGVQYTAFRAAYMSGKYVLTSGTADASPAVPASAVAVTGGTAAVPLALGLAQGGTESTVALPYIEYTVHFRFVFEAGRYFGSAAIKVLSSEMVLATDLAELATIATRRASVVKNQTIPSTVSVPTNAINGTVVL
jgi:hypothetical protein